MTLDLAFGLLGALALLQLILLGLLWLRSRSGSDAARLQELQELLEAWEDRWQDAQDGRLERLSRDLRGELGESARGTRLELGSRLADFQRTLLTQAGDVARTQNEQWRTLAESNDRRMGELRAAVEQRLAAVQGSVEERLHSLQADNEKRLEQMRATVDEKLHATLETRLGESFRQVAERLELVHRGLGEMQTLAQGVGDLKRVLGNVKTRGVFGEVQLAALLEQVFTPEQYAVNVATVPGSSERVEFAIRLPGRSTTGGDSPVWLPLDAKFPREDYERLLDAQDRADREAAEAAGKALEQRIRDEARSIAAKYLAPPHTTDFAVLFLPTEGLYAELLRRPGLSEALQRQHRVTLAGPTTLLAMLNSLQMGFRTLALEQRSSEVWTVLGAVKTEFGKFGDVLEKTRKKLQEAGHSIEQAEVRTRAMARQLRGVEALEAHTAEGLLGTTAALERAGLAGPSAGNGAS
ncbi:MAG: DNA recombination protein RmuC [Leptothrix sp. (in: Bacteria)]|jgi:DNA recombination protein RmuC|nr:DNA recombination protein RmuC [Leptothrix sp. (in: b-proteobacteria)]HQY08255.1 DNA recombination protein RmuC [Burkholderiaceae bacterium]